MNYEAILRYMCEELENNEMDKQNELIKEQSNECPVKSNQLRRGTLKSQSEWKMAVDQKENLVC